MAMLDDLFILSRHLIRLLNRPYERYFIRGVNLKGRCSIIVGKRGVGKTTTLVQHLLKQDAAVESSIETLYVPVDHFAVRQTPLYEIARDFVQQGGKRLYVDEIHKYPAWSRDLKSIIDTFPSLTVVASGSSMMQIRKGSHDLSRRAVVYPMHGMSFREFLEMRFHRKLPILGLEELVERHERIAADLMAVIVSSGTRPLAAFRDYVQFGVYPYYFEHSDRELFRATLEQNLHAAIESDLPAVHPQLSGVSIARIKMLLAAVAASAPLTPDLAKLRRLLEIADDRTLKTYLGYLEDAGLIMTFGKTGRDLKSMEKPRKIYLGDTNEAYALQPTGRADIGSIRETFFAQSVSTVGRLRIPEEGDFATDTGLVFEVGGRNKTGRQIRAKARAFLALDDIETGARGRIPLWLFGFLY
jgi:predicted AAA+ superfamily ATPase